MGRDALEAWIIQCDPAGDDGSGEHRTTIAAVLVAVDQFDEAQVTHLPADVRIASRFFARLRVPAEDNGEVVLTIPLFVGAHPQIVVVDPSHHAANASRNRLTILIGLISVFGVVFVAVRMALGRSRAARPAHGRTHLNDHRRPEMESDAEAKLPGDPADALAVLHSKSDSTKTEGA
jgi:hypothetical protein